MKVPKAVSDVINSFERLPGIGPKSAQRLALYLLHVPQGQLDDFAIAVQKLKRDTILCSRCHSIADSDPCAICTDKERDQQLICVVEQPLDVLALEKSGKYKGVYHVLHGKIDPLNNIGPEEIYLDSLIHRVKEDGERGIREIIIATNPTMEGEATAMYIQKQLKQVSTKVKVTRIGRGLPVGADIEYADDITLQRAMEGRSEFS